MSDIRCDAASYVGETYRCDLPHVAYVADGLNAIRALCSYHVSQIVQLKPVTIAGSAPNREKEYVHAGEDSPEFTIRPSIKRR